MSVRFCLCLSVVTGFPAFIPSVTSDTQPAKTVLVELFTSQGCSSCPPAENVLAELKANPAYRGKIVALGFHVDYWDGIGWKDPFSSPSFTNRQAVYGRVMKVRNVYTPQTVVDGTYEMLGSHKTKILEAVRHRGMSAAAFDMQIFVDTSAAQAGRRAKIRVKATGAPSVKVWMEPAGVGDTGTGGRGAADPKWMYAATFIPEATTHVRAGENSGRTLRQVNLVRAVAEPVPFRTDTAPLVVNFDLPFSSGDGVAAWIQDYRTFAVDQAVIWPAAERPIREN